MNQDILIDLKSCGFKLKMYIIYQNILNLVVLKILCWMLNVGIKGLRNIGSVISFKGNVILF